MSMENFSPDNCFDEMAKVLMPDREPTEVGYIELLEEVKKLKEENEKWKYWASEVIYWSHSASKDNLQAKKLITNDDKPTIANVRDFGKEIAELKEEKHKVIQDAYKCHYDTWKAEQENIVITELKEENTDLSEQIDELGVLCENIDENAFKTWKEITGRDDVR